MSRNAFLALLLSVLMAVPLQAQCGQSYTPGYYRNTYYSAPTYHAPTTTYEYSVKTLVLPVAAFIPVPIYFGASGSVTVGAQTQATATAAASAPAATTAASAGTARPAPTLAASPATIAREEKILKILESLDVRLKRLEAGAGIVPTSAPTPGSSPSPSPQVAQPQGAPVNGLQVALNKCATCHDEKVSEKNAKAVTLFKDGNLHDISLAKFKKIINVLDKGTMPPKTAPQLSEQEAAALVQFLTK